MCDSRILYIDNYRCYRSDSGPVRARPRRELAAALVAARTRVGPMVGGLYYRLYRISYVYNTIPPHATTQPTPARAERDDASRQHKHTRRVYMTYICCAACCAAAPAVFSFYRPRLTVSVFTDTSAHSAIAQIRSVGVQHGTVFYFLPPQHCLVSSTSCRPSSFCRPSAASRSPPRSLSARLPTFSP